MFNFFKKPSSPPPAPSTDDVDLHLQDIPGAIEQIEGFPRIHWPKVHEAVKPFASHPALPQIWTELAAQWLGVLRRHFDTDYKLYESPHFLLLSEQSPASAKRLLDLGDAAYLQLDRLLNRSEEERGKGKHVILALTQQDQYYDYISYFYAERTQAYGQSAGVHIRKGYRHTVLNVACRSIESTLVHELAHNMVALRPLPLWLNEGLAQFAEDMVPGWRPPLIDRRQLDLHRRYWSWFGIDHFWTGKGFSNVGSQRLSYQLSNILFRNLTAHPQRNTRLSQFLATAESRDAGESACNQCFKCSLETLVSEFLGPGEWSPQPRKVAPS